MTSAQSAPFAFAPRRALRAIRVEDSPSGVPPGLLAGTLVLTHEERHLRRRLLGLSGGGEILADLPETVRLEDGDQLELEDGRRVLICAASEMLFAVTAGPEAGAAPLLELAWHLGNRHFPAQIEAKRLVIARDPIVKAMLEGLGAKVAPVVEPFRPVNGAYHSHAHG